MAEEHELTWPDSLVMNAWPGEGESLASPLHEDATSWLLSNIPQGLAPYLPFPEVRPDELQWQDPRVGWGLILPHRPEKKREDLVELKDVPESVRQLWTDRGKGPVFRFNANSPEAFRLLFDLKNNRTVTMDRGAPMGTAPGKLPRYLLIYGTPEEVPWEVQYALNTVRAVGRLPFPNTTAEQSPADNYIQCLREGWENSQSQFAHILVWATESDYMTQLMRQEIADKLHQKYSTAAPDLRAEYLAGADATIPKLKGVLAKHRPGLIVTTSHGQTGPRSKPDVMRAKLGMPVDQEKKALSPDDLTDSWEGDGAIWYAHACCSAGSTKMSDFEGFFHPESDIGATLRNVSAMGSLVAPLPLALLGVPRPLRAFIGHVEPTFNYSLMQPANQESLTNSLVTALWTNLFQEKREPVGYAFRECYDRVGSFFNLLDLNHKDLRSRKADVASMRPAMLWSLLTAYDLRSMVILGDPTVLLPKS
jgi:hypothetical protein